ncbi:HD domain-containing protein [Piscinibacter terrae]|uniref:Bifunctional (P)ppGpp synthetase/guanosine-3',5'-bis(Diphosphate) 3'-pyrophosphohydrolase n=1 Tax=Piscinibacter terrae TaxID=2496871 RepID=A0A3N7HU92_9BURK|nr:HD domain-containing protein [Albitalea terrae]RQP25373.1 bifunctional (p)ppGpp synthetase/guanosine-3',5'-bis(diphosphate) 3'-pyrophosphohydrolase [Albitalea terrae]
MKEKARSLAVRAHGDQKYGEHPYVVHLDDVAALAQPYGEVAVAVAYLHDVVEDTTVGLAEVEDQFGKAVAACVALLTDEPGANRKERKTKTCAKLAQVRADNEVALVVKAADRLANVRACVTDGKKGLLSVYQGEHAAFRLAAFRPGLCDALWIELDSLLKDGTPDARR